MVYLLLSNTLLREVPEDSFLKPSKLSHFFLIWENIFSTFPYKVFVIVLLDIIGVENFPLPFSKS